MNPKENPMPDYTDVPFPRFDARDYVGTDHLGGTYWQGRKRPTPEHRLGFEVYLLGHHVVTFYLRLPRIW